MRFLVLNLLFASSYVFASTTSNFKKMDLSFNHKDNSTTRVIENEGATTTITQKFGSQDTAIDVVTKNIDVNNNVNVKFSIGTSGKNNQNAIMANPKW